MNIAFDLDGTLISCAQRQSTLLRSIAQALDVPCDSAAIWQLKRNGSSTEAALLQSGVDAQRARQIAAIWKRQIEEPYWLALDSLFADSVAMLQQLRVAGLHLFLLTARQRADLLRQQLRQLGIAALFEQILVVAPEHASRDKAEHLGLLQVRHFIGDSEADFLAASLAEVEFHGVSTGQRSAAYLQAQGVLRVAPDLRIAVHSLLHGNGDVKHGKSTLL